MLSFGFLGLLQAFEQLDKLGREFPVGLRRPGGLYRIAELLPRDLRADDSGDPSMRCSVFYCHSPSQPFLEQDWHSPSNAHPILKAASLTGIHRFSAMALSGHNGLHAHSFQILPAYGQQKLKDPAGMSSRDILFRRTGTQTVIVAFSSKPQKDAPC
ncbi:hypothetical protein [uncultured Phyllobacterium sp.]|uniref:hypothetical protein n=1 Tax=uncultured Phyllobacterium sp. TaxID=253813 RepID=UPI002584B899|nr:hypothetical protein [uncultured Phyllobacterium sp.]